jgi:hypothetical protein
MLIRAAAVWFSLAALAITNGALRDLVLTRRLGAQGSHIVSTLVLCSLIFAVTWLTIDWIGPHSDAEAFLIGALWLGMTLAFEFLAGHYLFKTSWDRLLADYNLARGRIWPLVLVVTLLAPWLAGLGRK